MHRNDSVKKFKSLRAIKPRPDWQLATRTMLLAQVRTDSQPISLGFFDYTRLLFGEARRQLFQPVAMMALVLGTFLGSSLVVNAAFYSLPGAPLYRVKLALERTQIAITPDEEKQLELKIEFARKRVDEVGKLAAAPDLDENTRARYVHVAVQELKRNVVAVAQQVDRLAAIDPALVNASDREKTLRIASSVQTQTTELAKTLDAKTASLTGFTETGAPVQDDLADVRKTAEQTSQLAFDLFTNTQAATSTQPTVTDDTTVPASTVATDNASSTPTTQPPVTASSTTEGASSGSGPAVPDAQ